MVVPTNSLQPCWCQVTKLYARYLIGWVCKPVGRNAGHQQLLPTTGQKMNVVDSFKKTRGRPKGSGAMTLRKYADNPQALTLPKTEQQQVKELKDLLIKSAGANVVHKAVEIAMNDEHPAQMAAIKLCMDRMLPVSLFEKEGKQRSAVNITISGIGGVVIGDNPIDAEYIESKDV